MSRSPDPVPTAPRSVAWFDQARLGLFVHFGLYSVAARHEWSMSYERRDPEDYRRYTEVFDPDRFDAADLARRACATGMRYAVLTTKHHEGFCLFESAHTDYSASAMCDRDLVREFVVAMRAEGLRVGFYYSLIDWAHPDFMIDRNHPLRDRPEAQRLNMGRDMSRYRRYLHAQVRELLTSYGRVDYLFFDFTYPAEDGTGKGPDDWDAQTLLDMVRELQPGCLVNDRLGNSGDLVTPEQYQPAAPMVDADGAPQRWEACQTTNGSWGYDRDNHEHKSADLLIRMIVDTVGKNGNLLLNVGPDGRGALPSQDRQIHTELENWMQLHSTSIHGAGADDIQPPTGTLLTRRGERLYIHLAVWPMQHVHVHGLGDRVRFARFLHDGSEVRHERNDPTQRASNMTMAGLGHEAVTFHVPTRRPPVSLPVIEVWLDDGENGMAPLDANPVR